MTTKQIGTRADTNAAIGAAVVVGMCTVGSAWLIVAGGWWLLGLAVTVLLGAICAYGVHDSLQVVPRDARGDRVQHLR